MTANGTPLGTHFGITTLHGVSQLSEENLHAADVVVLGIPYDVATHHARVGSRLGPQHIRVNSQPERRFLTDVSDGDGHSLSVVDAGDLEVVPGEYVDAFAKIEAAVDSIARAGAIPLALGGDGAVTLPQVRAVARVNPGLVAVHFDAHTDCYPVPEHAPFTNATTFTHAANEGLIDSGGSYHLGVRGTSSVADVVPFARSLDYHVRSTNELTAPGSRVISDMLSAIGDRPVFLSFDMDVFDPSVAPGVCTPEWGGVSAAEGIELIRSLKGLNIVAVDITTVSPPHDPQGLTGNLAARMALEILHILPAKR